MGVLRKLRGCSTGAVAVVTAMVLPVLLGFLSLGTEVGHWYLTQRVMQGSADAAAISAAAQWILDQSSGTNLYQQVGVNYVSYNGGFTIPTSNVCLIPASGSDNCGTVRSLDSRTIVCSSPPCVVVEITQNTLSWLTTKRSMEPVAGKVGKVQSVPTPTLKARAVVSMQVQPGKTITSTGLDCILALANDPGAITLGGNGDLVAKCGVSVDGGLDQNVSGTAKGGITFNGNGVLEVNDVAIAANQTYTQTCTGPHGDPCYLYNSSDPNGGSTTPLPQADFLSSTATADPYASQVAAMFATGGAAVPPSGVQSNTGTTPGVAITAAGSGYTNGTCKFTVTGGTYYGTTSTPAIFTATIKSNKVSSITAVIDPGAYKTLPTNPVSVTSTCGGSGATFNLAEGCFTWNGTVIPGRKYCSINLNGAGTTNFLAGNYWIAGGDSGCVGFCVSSKNATVTSDVAGVTFFLTNGDGSNSLGATSYATIAITSGSVSLCAPGLSSCGGTSPTCTGSATTSCMLFIQSPAATTGTSLSTTPANTFQGNGTRNFSGLIYIPKQEFTTQGVGAFEGCTGIIAKYFLINGTPEFANGCLPGHGIGSTTTTLPATYSNPTLYQ